MSSGQFNFDGRAVDFEEGWTVGAALTAAGIRSWRTTRQGGKPRGLFCGIGICFDCLITVDGQSSLRACLTSASDGIEAVSQDGTGRHELDR
jgi:predicted molibdopterin-dependent oxidoreductase YjgC